MSAGHYYNLCNRSRGKAVEIRTRDGRVHRGIINHVDREKVYLRPLGRGMGGYNYGGYGGYGGYGWGGGGFGLGIALGAIGTLAILPWFFW